LASSLLSLLLLVTFVWGGCISCEQYFMWPGTKTCCSPHGRCKTKAPSQPQNSGRECKQMAFDHQKSPDTHMDLPVVAVLPSAAPAWRVAERMAASPAIEPTAASPPDLQALHSTFRI
jgi:hypothetical protein